MRSYVVAMGWAALAALFLAAAPSRAASPDRTLPWSTVEVQAPRVEYRTFDSRVVGVKVSYHAYVPRVYAGTAARFPVLYWLHGTEGGVAGIRPLARFFDDAIEAGRVPPMIVVFVNGLPRRLWADSKDGASPVETVFVTEVIPDVDRVFRTKAAREGRVLEGFSMGGYGAARIGLKYPDVFAGMSILAGGPFDLEFAGPAAQRDPALRGQLLREVCGNDMAYFRAISPTEILAAGAAAARAAGTVVRLAVGRLDATWDLNRRFHERMLELGVAHEYIEVPGVGHDARALLEGLGVGNGRFYRRSLGLADRPADDRDSVK
jgi:enterochelin esterase-like enzyme